MIEQCDNCRKTKDEVPVCHGVWWTLSNYYKIWGYFCPDCFELVSHQSGIPRHKKEYRTIAVKQQLQRST